MVCETGQIRVAWRPHRRGDEPGPTENESSTANLVKRQLRTFSPVCSLNSQCLSQMMSLWCDQGMVATWFPGLRVFPPPHSACFIWGFGRGSDACTSGFSARYGAGFDNFDHTGSPGGGCSRRCPQLRESRCLSRQCAQSASGCCRHDSC